MLRAFNLRDLPRVEGWFEEAQTERWLGDPRWPRQLLRLASQSPPRLAFVAMLDDQPAGLVDIDIGDDGRAAIALVIAPHLRRRGIAKVILIALKRLPELADMTEIFGGVEQGNIAAVGLLTSAGFENTSEQPDQDGFTYYAMRVTAAR